MNTQEAYSVWGKPYDSLKRLITNGTVVAGGNIVNLRTLVFATVVATMAAYAQNPITADSTYQIRYASNLAIGDSIVNITNTGGNGGVTLQSGTTASVGGSICANVYV